ncbi:hypothetical protein [Haladaptatus sp. DYSN1]|uniref:DUF7319 domain-containing protein n=1 Tax=unclassified Haladaptatus TaxID=2622732 RepID=UPI002404C161|nr:hypothetical protein [Haladaptatus sp. DYSN1]
MGDARSTGADEPDETQDSSSADEEAPSVEELRRRVEEKYDFENFGPADMAKMTPEEWDVAFDADSWITGEELLARVESDLRWQIAVREVFARVQRVRDDGQECLLAYSDEGYAVVYSDGSVEGSGTVLRDVKPTVALCAMDDYEPHVAPEGRALPRPEDVREGSGKLGNTILLTVGGLNLLAGLVLLVGPFIYDPLLPRFCSPAPGGDGFVCGTPVGELTLFPVGRAILLTIIVGLGFVAFGFFLSVIVANARLSDRFRAEEYRERLRSLDVESGSYPESLPAEWRDRLQAARRARELDGTTEPERSENTSS